MDRLIKKIRENASMTQQELAYELGVTFSSVNRWENNKSYPNQMAQKGIYNFCKKKNIPIADLVIENIENKVKNIEAKNGRILLYHGSKSGIDGEILPISREECDFGAGFYMGTELTQPLSLICGYEYAKLYVVSVNADKLKKIKLDADFDWAMLVAFSRKKMQMLRGTDFYAKYATLTENADMVIGPIADDRMFYVLDGFFRNVIPDVAMLKCISALNLGNQYVAVTKKACKSITVETEIIISDLEKLVFMDISEAKRHEGIELANNICRLERRNGRFFEEILDEVVLS